MTTTVLVWILVLNSSVGGILKIENIATWEDCERLRIRSSQATNRTDNYTYVSGACTQVSLIVTHPAPAVVNVAPGPAPVVNNTVVIRKAIK